MALVHVMLNQAAVAFLQNKLQVRIRVKDGQLQFRPTHRSNDINLPKGERLLPIIRSSRNVYFAVKEDFLEGDRIMVVEEQNYGWYSLSYSDVDSKSVPSAKLLSVSPKNNKKQKSSVNAFDDVGKHAITA